MSHVWYEINTKLSAIQIIKHLKKVKKIMNNKNIYNVVNSVGILDCVNNVGNAFNKNRLEPWFVTGFTEGEGWFNITGPSGSTPVGLPRGIFKDNRQKIGWTVKLSFKIGLNEKDISLLEQIQFKFNVDKIYKQGLKLVQYRVESIKDLAVIIEHFDKYPLITQMRADYEFLKQAFKLMERGEHLTLEGLHKIVLPLPLAR